MFEATSPRGGFAPRATLESTRDGGENVSLHASAAVVGRDGDGVRRFDQFVADGNGPFGSGAPRGGAAPEALRIKLLWIAASAIADGVLPDFGPRLFARRGRRFILAAMRHRRGSTC